MYEVYTYKTTTKYRASPLSCHRARQLYPVQYRHWTDHTVTCPVFRDTVIKEKIYYDVFISRPSLRKNSGFMSCHSFLCDTHSTHYSVLCDLSSTSELIQHAVWPLFNLWSNTACCVTFQPLNHYKIMCELSSASDPIQHAVWPLFNLWSNTACCVASIRPLKHYSMLCDLLSTSEPLQLCYIISTSKPLQPCFMSSFQGKLLISLSPIW